MTGVAAVTVVAAYGLPTRHSVAGLELSDREVEALVAESERHRVLGLLGAAVHDGVLPLAAEHRAVVEHELQAWLAHDLRIERLLLDALRHLADAGIPSRVLKGVALAHTAYPDPARRVFGDVDLLVPSPQFSRAVSTLERAFATTRAQPELRPGFDNRFGKEAMLKVRGTLELDVHRVFVEGAFGLTIRTDDLFAPPYRFPLGGFELEALPMPARLLHACYAAAFGDWPPRLGSLRDVAQVLITERPNLVDVLLMAREWRCEIVVARAVKSAWQELAVLDRPPIVEWAERYEPSRTERMLFASHQGRARAFTRHAAALVVLPGMADRASYLRAIAWPQRSYLQARNLSRFRHARRAVRSVTG
jgi:putative nucleotidyltransferase-like protein